MSPLLPRPPLDALLLLTWVRPETQCRLHSARHYRRPVLTTFTSIHRSELISFRIPALLTIRFTGPNRSLVFTKSAVKNNIVCIIVSLVIHRYSVNRKKNLGWEEIEMSVLMNVAPDTPVNIVILPHQYSNMNSLGIRLRAGNSWN